MKLKSLLALALAGAVASTQAATVDVTGQITSNTTWTANNTYLLKGYVFVANNSTLTIEAGTVIKGEQSSGAGAAALVVTRGAKLNAIGTASNPIIFTSVLDDLQGSLTVADTGLWGGVVILGKARINSRSDGAAPASPAEDQIEGFSVSSDQIGLVTFGGTDDADSSGTIQYVSVRHGGAVLGTANEINGFSMGGVGSGTTMDHLEVFANKDDGYEFFGGTVNPRYLVAAFGNDDCFDFDQGFRGTLQFLFSIQTDITDDRGDKALEWDGATSPLSATPKGDVTVANYTAIGIGNAKQPGGSAGRANTAVNIRDNVTAKLYNSIFVNFAKGLLIESDVGDIAPDIKGNIFFSHIAANNTAAGLSDEGTISYTSTYFSDAANGNSIVDPQLKGISYTKEAVLDPRPATGSPALTAGVTLPSGLTAVAFKGAFSTTLWTTGWTKLSEEGYLTTDLGSDTNPDDFVPNAGSPSKLANVATRGPVGTAGNELIAGLVITGPQTQSVMIRAIGPGLTAFGVSGALADPVLSIRNSAGVEVASNDNWSGTKAVEYAGKLGAFALTEGSADAVVLATLPPGSYTAVVSGKGNTTGNALVEVYEIDLP